MVLVMSVCGLSGLHTANLSWQTRFGKFKLVCVKGTKADGKQFCKLLASNRNVFADCFYAVQTHQLEFANTSLPTLVCRVKAAFIVTGCTFQRTIYTTILTATQVVTGLLMIHVVPPNPIS